MIELEDDKLQDALDVVLSEQVDLEMYAAIDNESWCRVFISPHGLGDMWITLSAKVRCFRCGSRRNSSSALAYSVEQAKKILDEARPYAELKFRKQRRR